MHDLIDMQETGIFACILDVLLMLRALAYEAAYARYGVCGLLDVIDMFYINLDEKDATSSV